MSSTGFDRNYDGNGFEPSLEDLPIRERSFKTYDDSLGEGPPRAWIANEEQSSFLKQANISLEKMEDSLEAAGFWRLAQKDRHFLARFWFYGVAEWLRQSKVGESLSRQKAETNAACLYNCTMKDELSLYFAGFDCAND